MVFILRYVTNTSGQLYKYYLSRCRYERSIHRSPWDTELFHSINLPHALFTFLPSFLPSLLYFCLLVRRGSKTIYKALPTTVVAHAPELYGYVPITGILGFHPMQEWLEVVNIDSMNTYTRKNVSILTYSS